MTEFVSDFLEILVVIGYNIFRDRFVPAVVFVHEYSLLQESSEQWPEEFWLVDTFAQILEEFAAEITGHMSFSLDDTLFSQVNTPARCISPAKRHRVNWQKQSIDTQAKAYVYVEGLTFLVREITAVYISYLNDICKKAQSNDFDKQLAVLLQLELLCNPGNVKNI